LLTNKTALLKINLVYDIRQESTDKLQKLGFDRQDNQTHITLRAKYNDLKNQ